MSTTTTASKTKRLDRKGYILWLVLACFAILPSFFILQPLLYPEMDMSDPNPGEAALKEAAYLMGIASIPTAILIGRFTAYRSRDAGNSERTAYLAAVPIIGSIWVLRLLFQQSADA